MIDHDGDGVRNPTWFGRDVFLTNTTSLINFGDVHTSPQAKPFIVASGGLRESTFLSIPKKPYLNNVELSRYPFTDRRTTTGSFPLNEDPLTLNTVAYPNVFRYQSILPPSLPPQKITLFDKGWTTLTSETPRTDGIIVSLDREPFIPNFAYGAESSAGNSVISLPNTNRFTDSASASTLGCDNLTSDTNPPGLVLLSAMTVLKEALHVESCYFGPLTDSINNPFTAYATLLPNHQCGTNVVGSVPCKAIEVGYVNQIFGQNHVIKYVAPLPAGYNYN